MVIFEFAEVVNELRPAGPFNVFRYQVGFLCQDKVELMFYEKRIRQ